VILLNETQQEQLKEISANLRKIREDKSIRIEAIAEQTHIRLACLRALEESRFEELPEPVFIQGFIRRYAEVLGLDGIALANTFQVNLFASYHNSSPNSPSNPTRQIPLLFVPYLLLIGAAAIGLFYLLKPQITGKPLIKKQNLIAISEAKIPPSPAPIAITTVTPIPSVLNIATPNPTLAQNIAVTLAFQGTSWLQIKVDGKTEFTGVLNHGETKTWTGKKAVSIRAGNAGAVLVSVNQQKPAVFGNLGEVKEVIYPH
jgi:cytoskeletal protein RodZ